MVSMQDIANRVHVSRSTVSLVLSGKAGSRVSEAVKKEVLRTAKELNYHVNGVARSLRTGYSQLISVIVTDISNEFFGRLTFHIQEEAKKAGYLVLTINSNESLQEFDEMVSTLIGKKVDGVIAVPPPGSEESLARILAQNVPLVTVDRYFEGLDVDYVGVDNYDASRAAVDGLLSDGFRRISMVGLDLDIPPLNARQAAYEDAMRDAGYGEYIDVRRIPFSSDEDSGIDRVVSDLRDADAIFFTSRRVFTQAMNSIARHSVQMSGGQCMLCFDDVGPYMTLHSDIRCIEQPVEEMAHKAFELLIRQIKGSRETGKYLFPTRCIKH